MSEKLTFYRRCGKRLIDVLASSVLFVLLAPVLLVVAILVRCFLGSPVFFRQRRVGLHEREFKVLKFRTMTNERGADGELLPDAQRLRVVGRFLRAASLDELPQLWNVLIGDMSLVGPRPLYARYLPYYTERERLRHTVRPGITGLAQVSGRNLLSWDDRLELDALYVERQSFLYDLSLLFRTLPKVVLGSGVAKDAQPDVDVQRSLKLHAGQAYPAAARELQRID